MPESEEMMHHDKYFCMFSFENVFYKAPLCSRFTEKKKRLWEYTGPPKSKTKRDLTLTERIMDHAKFLAMNVSSLSIKSGFFVNLRGSRKSVEGQGM